MTNNPREEAARFLGHLRQFKNDRGAMAELRCALSPAKLHRAWPLLGRAGGIGDPIKETVAGLFGYHPDETDNGNCGTTCRRLADDNSTFEGRFQRLLSCDGREEVCERLRPIILAARARKIAVNYEQLFTDLRYWGTTVKARWAGQFWGVPEEEPLPAATEATT